MERAKLTTTPSRNSKLFMALIDPTEFALGEPWLLEASTA